MKDKIQIGCIILTLIAVFLLDSTKKDTVYSDYENRMLAKRPLFSAKSLFQGTLTKDFEDYLTDQFIGRNQWISVKTNTDLVLGKREIKGVYLGIDGSLIEKHVLENMNLTRLDKQINQLKRLKEEYPNTKIMLIPTADNIVSHLLPDFAEYYHQNELIDRVGKELGETAVIRVATQLIEHKKEYLYYKTDHHWTTAGAYYGYLSWCDDMQMSHVSFDAQQVSNDFYGTLHSKTNLAVKPDTIIAYQPSLPVSVTYDGEKKEKDSLYEPSYLETKNKYGYFLDDNHAFIEIDIENGETEERVLFVIKDSYANCFLPFLTNHYSKILVLDPRYYHGKLFSIMEEYGSMDMDVLVLYNVVHFMEEFQYY